MGPNKTLVMSQWTGSCLKPALKNKLYILDLKNLKYITIRLESPFTLSRDSSMTPAKKREFSDDLHIELCYVILHKHEQ